MKKTKRYTVEIELQSTTVYVSAKGIREAKQKAIEKLKKKNIVSLIDWEYGTHRKKISIIDVN